MFSRKSRRARRRWQAPAGGHLIRTREENAMGNRSTAISAAEVADDRAEIAAAVKAAKAFRDKLEGVGISYHKLLALEEARRDMNDLAHNILLGWENGEGFPHE